MKLTISKKMWLGFSSIIVLLLAVNATGIKFLFTVTDRYENIIDIDMKKIDLAENIQGVQKDMATAVLEYVMFGTDEAIEKLEAGIEEGSSYTSTLIGMTTDNESKNLLADLEAETSALFESNENIIALKSNGQDFSKYALNSNEINTKIFSILDDLILIQQQNADKTQETLEGHTKSMIRLIIIISTVSILVGIFAAYFISKGIANPIRKVTAGLEEIAAGNLLTEPIYIKNKDEVGMMANTYNKMLADLQNIVSNVRESSMQLAASAEQLSASAQESYASSQMVTAATEQQISMGKQQMDFIDTSVNSMVELNESVTHISSDNEEMLHAAADVQSLVTKGSSVVSDVANKMNMIHSTFNETTEIMNTMAKHSDDIQQVTSLITDISEQTNLLALNAAIEAARAGESGKGFAVVADEVRKLAEQSKLSAAEIEKMVKLMQTASSSAVQAITSGGDKVEEGLTRTSESLQVFNEIEASVSDVVEKVESVSAAIEEIQAMGESVTTNAIQVQQLAEKASERANETSAATEEQLATTEEISSSAQSLAQIAENLQGEVNRFKI